MTRFKIDSPPGATPIDPDESIGLIPDYISTQSELNSHESANIEKALIRIATRPPGKDLLTATFVFDLHKLMFGDVWKWAGKQRTTNKSIGVTKEQIYQSLGALLEDTKYWIENETYPPVEIATRFHHRLVQIHIFQNGNGRHARLMTDLLLESLDQERFTWGSRGNPTRLQVESDVRRRYIAALRAGDRMDLGPLLEFVRS